MEDKRGNDKRRESGNTEKGKDGGKGFRDFSSVPSRNFRSEEQKHRGANCTSNYKCT